MYTSWTPESRRDTNLEELTVRDWACETVPSRSLPGLRRRLHLRSPTYYRTNKHQRNRRKCGRSGEAHVVPKTRSIAVAPEVGLQDLLLWCSVLHSRRQSHRPTERARGAAVDAVLSTAGCHGVTAARRSFSSTSSRPLKSAATWWG